MTNLDQAAAPDPAPASFAVHIPDADLEPEPLDPAQIISGEPVVTGKVLWESADGKQLRVPVRTVSVRHEALLFRTEGWKTTVASLS